MKLHILLLSILMLMALTNALEDFTYVVDNRGTAKIDELNIFLGNTKLSLPKKVKDQLTFTVSTTTSVLICVQERLQVTSGLTSCNPDGFFHLRVNHTGNATNQVTSFSQVYHSRITDDPPTTKFLVHRSLRVSRDFWVSYQLVDLRANSTDFIFRLEITAELCDGDDDKWGPKCDNSQYKVVKDLLKDEKLDPNETKFYLLAHNAEQIKKLEAVLSHAQNVSFYYRRGGFPSADHHDAAAVKRDNDTVLDLPYPRKEEAYHFFSLTNTGKEAQTVTINVTTNVNASKPEMTEIDADALLKDKAKNTVDSAKTKSNKGDISFFTYKKSGDQNNIIVGIAADDDETPDIYIDTDGYPSPVSYLISNTNKTEAVHLVVATADPKPTNWYTFNVGDNLLANYTWYIGVVANSDYTIFVGECARNCSEKGVCNKGTGVCFCDDGREGYDCADRSFPILWIILIAIGSAIALAIAIAVPVTCYVRSKRNSGYERV